MMRNPLKIVSPRSARSVEREVLAAAIERHESIKQAAAAIPIALQTVRDRVYAARRAVDLATEAVETAKANSAAHLTAMVLGTAGTAPQTVKDARAALQDAQDDLEAAETARDALIEHQTQVDESVRSSKWPLEAAIKAVMKTEAPIVPLIEKLMLLKRETEGLRRAVSFLTLRCEVRPNDLPRDLSFWANTDHTWPGLPGDEPWKAWQVALETDADALMPAP